MCIYIYASAKFILSEINGDVITAAAKHAGALKSIFSLHQIQIREPARIVGGGGSGKRTKKEARR